MHEQVIFLDPILGRCQRPIVQADRVELELFAI